MRRESTIPDTWDEFVKELPYQVFLRVDDDDYQGDSRFLIRHRCKLGFMVIGWGSCEGCDALMACNTIADYEALKQVIINGIRWFDTEQQAIEWFKTHDWKGDFLGWNPRTTRFVETAVALLAPYPNA